jgi:PKHD-type hydroxylase
MRFHYYILDDLYSKEECIVMDEKIQANIAHDLHDRPAEGITKTSDVSAFQYRRLKPELNRFTEAILDLNKNHFGFNLHQINDNEFINYNEYRVGGEYEWHSDESTYGASDIKLTAILNISSESYEGGEFQLFLNGEVGIFRLENPGTALVFISSIQHRVTPVTKGVRKTISHWVTGPKLC